MRAWLVVFVIISLISGAAGAVVIDWPNEPGQCVAVWSRCAP